MDLLSGARSNLSKMEFRETTKTKTDQFNGVLVKIASKSH